MTSARHPRPRRTRITPGARISYRGVGPGRITDIRGDGDDAVVVISIPHSEMTIEVPLANTALMERIRPLITRDEARGLLRLPRVHGAKPLPATWARRRTLIEAAYASDSPQQWAGVVWALARFVKTGDGFTASDHSALTRLLDQLSAEISVVLDRTQESVEAALMERFIAIAGQEPRPHRTRTVVGGIDDTE